MGIYVDQDGVEFDTDAVGRRLSLFYVSDSMKLRFDRDLLRNTHDVSVSFDMLKMGNPDKTTYTYRYGLNLSLTDEMLRAIYFSVSDLVSDELFRRQVSIHKDFFAKCWNAAGMFNKTSIERERFLGINDKEAVFLMERNKMPVAWTP